ncbi:MAG: 6-phosphofructokinase [Thermoguttaceae bacterium]
MTTTLSRPPMLESSIRRVAIVFAGGPAPAANAVISTAAVSFLRNNIDVLGILHGYSHLVEFGPDHPMVEGRDYLTITHKTLKRSRNSQGILIGTARTNPGKEISEPAHLRDPKRTKALRTTYDALVSLGVDALISIGGDDTLKTANKFKLFQEQLPPGSRRIPIVHLPKTIDNDYMGIDFTFGYFTAVEFLASEVRNLLADAEANRAYFLAECMGRSAGWLAYGVAIAGEASLVISVEDITGKYETTEESANPRTGRKEIRRVMDLDEVVKRIVATMRVREEAEGKEFGVLILAEGLAELLPLEHIEGVPRDDHGHIAITKLDLGRLFSDLVAAEYARQTGKKRKITPVKLGYESRCAPPHAFDVMLGSQLAAAPRRTPSTSCWAPNSAWAPTGRWWRNAWTASWSPSPDNST